MILSACRPCNDVICIHGPSGKSKKNQIFVGCFYAGDNYMMRYDISGRSFWEQPLLILNPLYFFYLNGYIVDFSPFKICLFFPGRCYSIHIFQLSDHTTQFQHPHKMAGHLFR